MQNLKDKLISLELEETNLIDIIASIENDVHSAKVSNNRKDSETYNFHLKRANKALNDLRREIKVMKSQIRMIEQEEATKVREEEKLRKQEAHKLFLEQSAINRAEKLAKRAKSYEEWSAMSLIDKLLRVKGA